MKKHLLLVGVVLFMSSNNCFAQNQSEKFELVSNEVKGEIYSIEVVLPDDYDSTKKYPIIYFTDWFFAADITKSIYHILQVSGKIEPIIIVGIQRKNSITNKDWQRNRWFELTPTKVKENGGGAKQFLSFIKNELIPFVENKYTLKPENRGYCGYSLGGLFGAYILLNEPDVFDKYLIGSPYLMYDNYLLSKELSGKEFVNLTSIESIFIAVEEEGDQLRAFEDLREFLIRRKPSGLNLETIIIQNEDHYTAIPSTILKGLKYLYKK